MCYQISSLLISGFNGGRGPTAWAKECTEYPGVVQDPGDPYRESLCLVHFSSFCIHFFLATQSSPQSSHLWALGLRCMRVTPAGSSQLQRLSQRSGRRCPLPRAAWLDVHSTASNGISRSRPNVQLLTFQSSGKNVHGDHISQHWFGKLTGKPVCGLKTP
jgi:hypothetical protein